jgi:DNA-binding transcriptional LysR family regulator
LTELSRKSQLATHFLLEFDDPSRTWLQWPEWFQRRGWTDVRSKGVLRFNLYDQVIHGALAGNGVALGRLALVGPLLKEGRLTALSGISDQATFDHGYWLTEATTDPRIDVLKVVDWIRMEAATPH